MIGTEQETTISSRIVYIHCGLHKTGTTAIQQAFSENTELLKHHGVSYPQTRDEWCGHHNLAWQLNNDARFCRGGLSIADAVQEVRAFGGKTVFSSEDFESLLHTPEAFKSLVGQLRALGFNVVLVVYVRKRRNYVEALYAELLKHGYDKTFEEFSCEARRAHQLRHQCWTFQLDIQSVREAVAGALGIYLLERDFDELARTGISVVTDFLQVIGMPGDLLQDASDRRINERFPAKEVLSQFLTNYAGRSLRSTENERLERVLALVTNQFELSTERLCSVQSAVGLLDWAKDTAGTEHELILWWQNHRLSVSVPCERDERAL